MPTYPYKCPQCGHDFDVFQKISDAPQANCPKCSSNLPERQIAGGNATFQFKGSGFYLTDYKERTATDVPTPPKGGCCPCGKPPGSGGCGNSSKE